MAWRACSYRAIPQRTQRPKVSSRQTQKKERNFRSSLRVPRAGVEVQGLLSRKLARIPLKNSADLKKVEQYITIISAQPLIKVSTATLHYGESIGVSLWGLGCGLASLLVQSHTATHTTTKGRLSPNTKNQTQKKRETFASLSQYPEPGSNRHRGEPTGV